MRDQPHKLDYHAPPNREPLIKRFVRLAFDPFAAAFLILAALGLIALLRFVQ